MSDLFFVVARDGPSNTSCQNYVDKVKDRGGSSDGCVNDVTGFILGKHEEW